MDVATIDLFDAGIRKAAVFVATLDPTAADQVLDRLDPEQAKLVRQAMTTLDEINSTERRRILDEFRRVRPLVPEKCPPGIELDGLPTGQSLGVPDATQHTIDEHHFPADVPDAPPFDFLRDAEAERLAKLLGGERPQTVALVLSHLPPERAGGVLASLANSLQIEVVRRLVDLENTDPETLREVEQALEARLSQQFAIERERAAGPETVAKILASCDREVRGQILGNLAAHDQPLAERFGCRAIRFEDLVQFDDALLLAIFQAADPEVAHMALLGAPPAIFERLLRCMPSEEAKRLRCKLEQPGPIRLSDIDEAQCRIVALARCMSHDTPNNTAFAA